MAFNVEMKSESFNTIELWDWSAAHIVASLLVFDFILLCIEIRKIFVRFAVLCISFYFCLLVWSVLGSDTERSLQAIWYDTLFPHFQTQIRVPPLGWMDLIDCAKNVIKVLVTPWRSLVTGNSVSVFS